MGTEHLVTTRRTVQVLGVHTEAGRMDRREATMRVSERTLASLTEADRVVIEEVVEVASRDGCIALPH